MEIKETYIKPFTVKLENIPLWKVRSISTKAQKRLISEGVTITSVERNWDARHPLCKTVLIKGTCTIPEENIEHFRQHFHQVNKDRLVAKKPDVKSAMNEIRLTRKS